MPIAISFVASGIAALSGLTVSITLISWVAGPTNVAETLDRVVRISGRPRESVDMAFIGYLDAAWTSFAHEVTSTTKTITVTAIAAVAIITGIALATRLLREGEKSAARMVGGCIGFFTAMVCLGIFSETLDARAYDAMTTFESLAVRGRPDVLEIRGSPLQVP